MVETECYHVQVFQPKRIYIKFPGNSCQDLRALAPDVEELLSTYQLTLQELIPDMCKQNASSMQVPNKTK